VVHLSGGTVALVGAIMLGPRIGRFRPGLKGNDSPGIVGHSIPLVSLGAFILVFGFFAFNGGSQASISVAGDGELVTQIQNVKYNYKVHKCR
jgi:Amt family ammonium transporter